MASNTNGQQSTRVVTGKVRLSYAHLFEPYAVNPDQEAKYSCVLLIPKTDKATVAKLKAAEEAAKQAGVGSRWNGKMPPVVQSIIHDGDTEADLERNPEYAGHLFMSVSSKTAPGVVDAQVQPILDSTEVYSGCYVRASINAFPYSAQGNKGVSFGLNHIQKIADGDNLGGRSRAEDDFEAYEEDLDSVI